ncbi:5-formyltetrahydrofolate cyclo-ligase [Aureimonas endophytica]|uniref:5-formyltetrahydrofolate cyclo-ligase n=1 Tax=Aureimonas endophytica TaxID=2027858 RepID=A0A916ZFH9_9HYPH|nr:5-formyltetrahydrofolate cyclo-ligase [Aureimonas endophytica]GGD94476.1 5-formyltetrahydrofolate cyclo-ligase [Aureimonas endophytica]
MSGSLSEKARLRAEALARRDAMDGAARIEAGFAVAETVAADLAFEPGTVVSGFLPIRSEIDLRPLMAILADRGARLCVPAIVGEDLEFRELRRGAALEPQGFGTYAPGADAPVLDPAIMLVPFAAFDRRGHRIGYGRGYYDRAIARLASAGRPPRTLGLGFAVQEVPRVPDEPHDAALDLIATECGIHRGS